MDKLTINAQQPSAAQTAPSSREDRELKKACLEFEAVFVRMMLSEMDATVSREDGFLEEGTGGDIVRQMYNEQVADAAAGRWGIAAQLYRELEQRAATTAKDLPGSTDNSNGRARPSSK